MTSVQLLLRREASRVSGPRQGPGDWPQSTRGTRHKCHLRRGEDSGASCDEERSWALGTCAQGSE